MRVERRAQTPLEPSRGAGRGPAAWRLIGELWSGWLRLLFGIWNQWKGAVALFGLLFCAHAAPACDALACVGASARLCVDDGAEPVGVCYGNEAADWEARSAAVMAEFGASGAGAEALQSAIEWPVPVPTLAAVQAAFEAYRDAVCDMEAALWGNGSGAGEAWIACRMRVAAEHALRLEAWVRDLE